MTYNESLVLEVIWRAGTTSRSEIVEATGLSGPAVSGFAKKLLSAGLIEVEVDRSGARGQPVKLLRLRPGGAYALGVNFTYRKLDVGVVDLSGCLIKSHTIPLTEPTVQAIGTGLRRCSEALLDELRISHDRITGLGISLPGDFTDKDVASITTYGRFGDLENKPLAREFSRYVPFEIFVENDGASGAIGESLHGAAQGLNNFVFLHIRHGIKAGVFINGRLYRGARGNAGLVGSLWPNDGVSPRPTGEDLLRALSNTKPDIEDFPDLRKLDPAIDPVVAPWLDQASDQLSGGMDLIAKFFDPEALIIGGDLPASFNNVIASKIRLAEHYAKTGNLSPPMIICSELGEKAGLVGAASSAFFGKLLVEHAPNSLVSYTSSL